MGQPANPKSADNQSSPAIEWSHATWGDLGIARLKAAPFPDDTRTTGYQTSKGVVYPFKGHYDDDSVAFAIPRSFKPAPTANFVVICHGHVNQCRRFIEENRIGDVLEASGVNAILIVPQGPKDAADSGGGKFEKPGGFSSFMQEAVQTLRADAKLAPTTTLGNIALCGYSGGGRPVAFCLDLGGMNTNISEVWLVDAAYQLQAQLAAPFAPVHSNKVLRSIFTTPNAPENATIMAYICREGKRVSVADDEISSVSEIARSLQKEPLSFIHTELPHDAFKLTERYLPVLFQNSPTLGPKR